MSQNVVTVTGCYAITNSICDVTHHVNVNAELKYNPPWQSCKYLSSSVVDGKGITVFT